MVIKVYTRDRVIWNVNEMIIDMCKSMSDNKDIVIDLDSEGCDCRDIGLYDIIDNCAKKFDYDVSRISILTCNMLEHHDVINIIISFTWSDLNREVRYHGNDVLPKKQMLKHFGRFIGRSNAPRLILSTYLDEHYPDKTLATYHYRIDDDYQKDYIGLESIINDFQISNLEPYARFLASCPRILDHDFKFQFGVADDYYSQMMANDKTQFITKYSEIFVDIVSESFYNGNTFFATEKTFRPILCETPFVMQGSTGFLKQLKKLGFKTFDRWWNEGYDADPPSYAIKEITKVIDYLASKSQDELQSMLSDMQDVLNYNRDLLLEMARKHAITTK
jgi:hypothetical protein